MAGDPGPDVNRFVQEHGRLPCLGDPVPPWHYRGWLLWYVHLAHQVIPETGNRWGYWMRTLDAGELLPEMIPPVHFETKALGQSNSAAVKNIEACMRIIEMKGQSVWGSFRLFVEWLAWGLATTKRRPELNEDTNEGLYRTCNLEPWLQAPGDHLGEVLAAKHAGGWNPNAFFPTPHAICELMVQMTMADAMDPQFVAAGPQGALRDGRDVRLATVCDPAVGTGRMLLHAAQVSFCLAGQDIDGLVVDICMINGALYAPWLAFPMPAEMLARCKAVRYQVDEQSGEELPPIVVPPPPAEPLPLELEVALEALARARDLAKAVLEEDVETDTNLLIDRHGQGLLFGEILKPKPGRRRGLRAAERSNENNGKDTCDE